MTDEELLQLAEATPRLGTTDGGAPAPASPSEYVAPAPPVSAPVVGDAPAPSGGVSAPPLPQFAPAGPALPEGGLTPPGSQPPKVDRPAALTSNDPNLDTRAIEAERQAQLDVADAKAAEGPAIKAKAEGEADIHDQMAAQQRDQQVELQAELQAQADGQARARQIADQAEADYAGHKLKDFYADAPTHTKILRALAVGLGGMQVGTRENGNTGTNEALQILTKRADDFNRKQQLELATKENFARMKREGVRDLAAQYRTDIANLQLKHAMGVNAIADEAKAQLIRNGIPAEQAEQNTLVMGLRAKAQSDYAKGYQQLVKDQAQMALERSRLGATWAGVGIARQNADTAAGRAADAAEAKRRAAADKEDSLAVRAHGEIIGFANSPRVVKQIEDRNTNYDDAVKSLEALKKRAESGITGRIAKGDDYDRAVLAISTVTTANASDKTTAHEAGTLTNKLGLLDPKAIETNLEHIRARQKEFLSQLRPAEAAPAQRSTSTPAAAPRHSAAEIEQAETWVDANPKDPRAGAVRKKIAAWKSE